MTKFGQLGKVSMNNKLSFTSVTECVHFWKRVDTSECSDLVLNQMNEQIESQIFDQVFSQLWKSWNIKNV